MELWKLFLFWLYWGSCLRKRKRNSNIKMTCSFDLLNLLLFARSWKVNELLLSHVCGIFNYRHYLEDTWKHSRGIFCAVLIVRTRELLFMWKNRYIFFFQGIMQFEVSLCFMCFSGLIKAFTWLRKLVPMLICLTDVFWLLEFKWKWES